MGMGMMKWSTVRYDGPLMNRGEIAGIMELSKLTSTISMFVRGLRYVVLRQERMHNAEQFQF